MSEKSYVTMTRKICFVTGKPYDTEELLFDLRLEPTFEKYTITGYGICPEVQRLLDEGNVALVGIIPEKSNLTGTEGVKAEDVYRSGIICYIRDYAFEHIFKQKVPPQKFIFIDTKVINQLKERVSNEIN